MRACFTLLLREVQRFYRQPSRVIGAFGPPLIFWGVLALGFEGHIRVNESQYGEFFFPSTVVLVILFTSIFANMSVIEDRHSGFLQGVLVAPIHWSSIVLGKVLGGTALGTLQGTLLIFVYWLLNGFPFMSVVAQVILIVGLLSFVLSALGFVFAWWLDSTQGFHGVMNIILMPMWILSGALFPLVEEGVLRTLMLVNPLRFGLNFLRAGLANSMAVTTPISGWAQCVLVLGGFGVALFALGHWVVWLSERRLV